MSTKKWPSPQVDAELIAKLIINYRNWRMIDVAIKKRGGKPTRHLEWCDRYYREPITIDGREYIPDFAAVDNENDLQQHPERFLLPVEPRAQHGDA